MAATFSRSSRLEKCRKLQKPNAFTYKFLQVVELPTGKQTNAQNRKITVWGTGEEERDLLYIDDLQDAVAASIERQEADFGLYNIGSGSSVSIKELVNTMIQRAQVELQVEHDLTKPTIPTKLCVDFSKAQSELGWQPQTSLENGIDQTLAWYRKNL